MNTTTETWQRSFPTAIIGGAPLSRIRGAGKGRFRRGVPRRHGGGGAGGPPPARRGRRGEEGGRRREPPPDSGGHHRGAPLPGDRGLHRSPTEIAAHADTADIGISGVEFGVAETGSVFQDGYAIATRLVTILPPLHVVFLPSANIVPGITEAFEIIAKNFDRGYVGFITGPSRTADIERVLTIGVHGPSRFAIIAVDEEPKGGAA